MRIGVTMLTSWSVDASATVQRAEEMKKSQQSVAPYVAQGATKVNADVGTGIYMATARTMDPPPLRNEGHGRRGNDIGNEARNSR